MVMVAPPAAGLRWWEIGDPVARSWSTSDAVGDESLLLRDAEQETGQL